MSMSIDQFAEENGLKLEFKIRDFEKFTSQMRYYCYFKKIEVKDGIILSSEFGNGMIPLSAKIEYSKRISGKVLVYDAYGENRRIINCPILDIQNIIL